MVATRLRCHIIKLAAFLYTSPELSSWKQTFQALHTRGRQRPSRESTLIVKFRISYDESCTGGLIKYAPTMIRNEPSSSHQ